MQSPLGPLRLVASDTGLSMVHLGEPSTAAACCDAAAAHVILDRAEAQLAEYFTGRRTVFELPLDQHGSGFQRQVWTALADIPYGTTVSYGELAQRVGMPSAAQAVGLACGSNPIAIVVPCHRVIGANGRLTGYAGGLDRKRDLLAWEQRDSLLF
jgi:methylated-DNA-[protein]-cysteine S-methyltransferase